jgi:hypothetical protein
MFSVRRGLGLALLVLLGALAILALPGPAHAAAGPDLPPAVYGAPYQR